MNSAPQIDDSSKVEINDKKIFKNKLIGNSGYFYDHGDGTVTDMRTGLVWMRFASYYGHSLKSDLTPDSLDYIPINLKNRAWRLPTHEELKGLVNHNKAGPTIDIEVFPNTPGGYFWTSTHVETNPRDIWQIDFSVGRSYGNRPNVKAFIRLVHNALKYTLSINKIGSGDGNILRDVVAVEYDFGKTVRLTAEALEGSIFKSWHGDVTSTSATCVVTMDAAKTVIAEFAGVTFFELSLCAKGVGRGTVTSNPEADQYLLGSMVKLSAHPSNDSKFVGWRGDVEDISDITSLTINSNKAVAAVFEFLRFFKLKVQSTGSGGGLVTWNPIADKYVEGSTVTLTARPDNGSKFVGWHGNASGLSNTCTITIDSDREIQAEFTKIPSFVLNYKAIGNRKGTLSCVINSGELVKKPDGDRFIEGSVVSLTAVPGHGSKFVGWHGDASGCTSTCTIKIDSNKEIRARQRHSKLRHR